MQLELRAHISFLVLQEDDIEPPAPYETAMTLSNMVQSGETMIQPFVSPAILQANETGEQQRDQKMVMELNMSCRPIFSLTLHSFLSAFQVLWSLLEIGRVDRNTSVHARLPRWALSQSWTL